MIFVTGNEGKFREAEQLFRKAGLRLEWRKLKIPEPRGTLEEISEYKAKYAYAKIRKPLFVEDSGLFVKALNGFPGEYSKWVYEKIGLEGILRLLEGKPREAYFKAVVTYTDEKTTKQFVGISPGQIAYRPAGHNGFMYDPLFIPAGYEKTFAEDSEYKQQVSHRRKAVEKLIKWLLSTKF